MISLDLMKSSEVRKAGDQSNNVTKLFRNKKGKENDFSSFHKLDRSPAILTSHDFIRSNEIIRTKWPICVVIGHFVLTI